MKLCEGIMPLLLGAGMRIFAILFTATLSLAGTAAERSMDYGSGNHMLPVCKWHIGNCRRTPKPWTKAGVPA
jgi:hypothetical protein